MVERKRWEEEDLIELFTYIDNNFDSWYDDPNEVYVKAMQNIDTSRKIEFVDLKVSRMLGAIDTHIKTGQKKVKSIWDNKKIRVLVKRVYYKSKERKREENRGTATKRPRRDEEQETSKKSPKFVHGISVFDVIDLEANEEIEASTSRMDDDSIETLYNLKMQEAQETDRDYKRLLNLTEEISKLDSLLKDKINEREDKINEKEAITEQLMKRLNNFK